MALSLWLSLALVCMMGAMSPGPSLAVVLKHSLSGGMKNGMLAALSHGFGVGLYAAASLLGLGALMLQFPTVYQFLVYLGAAYLTSNDQQRHNQAVTKQRCKIFFLQLR